MLVVPMRSTRDEDLQEVVEASRRRGTRSCSARIAKSTPSSVRGRGAGGTRCARGRSRAGSGRSRRLPARRSRRTRPACRPRSETAVRRSVTWPSSITDPPYLGAGRFFGATSPGRVWSSAAACDGMHQLCDCGMDTGGDELSPLPSSGWRGSQGSRFPTGCTTSTRVATTVRTSTSGAGAGSSTSAIDAGGPAPRLARPGGLPDDESLPSRAADRRGRPERRDARPRGPLCPRVEPYDRTDTGHLFGERLTCHLIDSEPYLLEAVRYVLLNPVRSAGRSRSALLALQQHALDCRLEAPRPYLDIEWVLSQFGRKLTSSRLAFTEFVLEGIGRPLDLPGREVAMP